MTVCALQAILQYTVLAELCFTHSEIEHVQYAKPEIIRILVKMTFGQNYVMYITGYGILCFAR